ncbi:MAG: hypothetical protein UT50_C0001G0004 [Candidatus Moranbacteria bacterium GW2011_GWA2_39_41]|nr:MAG: hypothetical protein UT50_C0001G0004 [Candidatus Moranbacteria bacterium GW2011_GWA2_39_41]
MKKTMIVLLAGALVMFGFSQAMAETFPTADSHTLVSADQGGAVTVKAVGESSWVLVQYCQDNMRAGCANNIVIKPSEDSGGTMKFQLDNEGVADGQVAFNFRKTSLPGNPWLAIPDCRVKTTGLAGMGMSYHTPDIAESGGAHFVFTGTQIKIWSPVPSGEWCDEQRIARAPIAQVIPRAYVVPPVGPRRTSSTRDGCTTCEKKILAKVEEVKEDTTAIRESVGDVNPKEVEGERTLQQKSRIILAKTKKIEKAVGEDANKGGVQLSLHDKIGVPTNSNDTVMSKLDKIDDATFLGLLAGIASVILLALILAWLVARRNRPTDDQATQPPAAPQGGGQV